jgi:4'-phosphopantetheinyl transferase
MSDVSLRSSRDISSSPFKVSHALPTRIIMGSMRSMRDSRSLELQGRAVHVRPVRLEASDAGLSQLELTLAPDELDRAARFRSDSLRRSFVVARGALRALLGRYLSKPPASLRFTYGPKGKPSIDESSGVAFNTSHAGQIVTIALTLGCELGIDIEPIRSIPDMKEVAHRFFCSAEVEELVSLPENQRDLGFYLCWTRRESYIKATGESLLTVTDQLQVSLRPDEPARLIQVPHGTDRASAWSLHDLDLVPGYAAALTYQDFKRPVQVFPLIDVDDLLIT